MREKHTHGARAGVHRRFQLRQQRIDPQTVFGGYENSGRRYEVKLHGRVGFVVDGYDRLAGSAKLIEQPLGNGALACAFLGGFGGIDKVDDDIGKRYLIQR